MGGGLDPQGPVAGEIAGLWWLLFWLGLLAFVVFAAALGVALFRRRSSDASRRDDPARRVRRWIVTLGVWMTSALLIVVMAFTVASMRAIPRAGADGALRLNLTAHQWYWDIRYPLDGITTRDVMRIPTGRQVELRITSADVIHSFWVPSLAGKIDAIPERTNTLVLRADRPGTYRGQCAEFCGVDHARMRIAVIAMEPEAYAAWVEGAR